jgi:hypothetical protein
MKTTPPAQSSRSLNRAQRFEKKLYAVQHAAAQLPGEEFYAEILGTIQSPDWNAVADGLFFEAIVDTIQARLNELAELHKRLKHIAIPDDPGSSPSFSFSALSGKDVLRSAAPPAESAAPLFAAG